MKIVATGVIGILSVCINLSLQGSTKQGRKMDESTSSTWNTMETIGIISHIPQSRTYTVTNTISTTVARFQVNVDMKEDKTYRDILMAVGIPIASFVLFTSVIFMLINSRQRSKRAINIDLISIDQNVADTVRASKRTELRDGADNVVFTEESGFELLTTSAQADNAVLPEENGYALLTTNAKADKAVLSGENCEELLTTSACAEEHPYCKIKHIENIS